MLSTIRACAILLGFASAILSTVNADETPRKTKSETWEQDDHEEKSILQASQRVKTAEHEGVRWQREIDKAYPKQIGKGYTEEDVSKWFTVLMGDNKDWRRDSAPNKQILEMYDRVAQRMELGPVPSIRREEFLQFAKGRLIQQPRPMQKPGEQFPEADRVFRVLDRDGSGVLEASEWTERIRNDLKRADTDGNRKIDLDEYRKFFEVNAIDTAETVAKTLAAMKPEVPARAGKLPTWFMTLDTDGDGQIGLYEWRAANKPIAEFLAMDLDGDGLLPPDEYFRYLKKVENDTKAAESEKRPSEMPPEHRAGGKNEKK